MSEQNSHGIFIKTCQHDSAYHRFCMRSIEKYTTGFIDTVVADGEHPQGYLHQQVVKLHADLYTSADIIWVSDSDTLFNQNVTPDRMMRDGKPIWYITPFSSLEVSGGVQAWYEVMHDFFGVEPEYEFMRRQPFVFPRWILPKLREYCVNKHGRTIEQYPFDKGRFTEWNILGQFAWLFYRDAFSWINTNDECPPPFVTQFWSHDPISKNIQQINQILA